MLTAFSMISMLIKIEIALRLLSAPKRPMQKTTAPRTRNVCRLTLISCLLLFASDHDCADDSYQQYDRSYLKRQNIAVAERTIKELAQPHYAAAVGSTTWWEYIGTGATRDQDTMSNRKDDSPTEKNADQRCQPPLRADWIAVATHAVLRQHNGEQDQDGDCARVDQHLHDRYEL